MNSQPISPRESNSITTGSSTDANTPSPVSQAAATTSHLSPAPAPKAGIRTTQFWLLAGVLALVAWMVFAGKLEAGWFALLAPVAAVVYQCVRENLYRDANTHPNDALNQILETVLAQLPAPSGADATAVIAALRHPHAAPAPAPNPPSPSAETGGIASPATLGVVSALGAMLVCLSGCAETPYYVSGITGMVDTSKDGSSIRGGGLGVTFSPNPYYPGAGATPVRPLPSTLGYAK